MPTLREAAQQALEALECSETPEHRVQCEVEAKAIAALRAALAEPEQEPVAWLRVIDEAMVTHHLGVADPADDYETAKRKLNSLLCCAQDIGAYFASSLQQPAPEPVSNTTTLRAMLECCLSWEPNACVLGNVTARQAVIALRAALAEEQAEPEPVAAWKHAAVLEKFVGPDANGRAALDALYKLAALAQEQAEPEPVAWIQRRMVDSFPTEGYETCEATDYGAIPVYTAPPAPKREPLNEAQAEPEPVAWVCTDDEMRHRDPRWGRVKWIESEDECAGRFLYTASPAPRGKT